MCFVCLFVCLSFFFFCLFVCYHSRAVYVESALGLEMLDPSLSREADRRPVEIGPAEFLNYRNLMYVREIKFTMKRMSKRGIFTIMRRVKK